MTIKTVKDLKELVKNLPDDMPVEGWKGNGVPYPVDGSVFLKSSLTEEELRDGYPNGFVDKLIIDVD